MAAAATLRLTNGLLDEERRGAVGRARPPKNLHLLSTPKLSVPVRPSRSASVYGDSAERQMAAWVDVAAG